MNDKGDKLRNFEIVDEAVCEVTKSRGDAVVDIDRYLALLICKKAREDERKKLEAENAELKIKVIGLKETLQFVKESVNMHEARWEKLKEETKRYGGIVFYSNEMLKFTKVVTIRALQKKMHELEKGDGKG